MSVLKVSLVQSKIEWHNPDKNFRSLDSLVYTIEETDLIILPEMWATGFTMKAHNYHSFTAEALEYMKKWAKQKDATIAGSLICKEGEKYYNRLYVIEPNAVEKHYDKKHLFGYAGEDRIYSPGKDQLIFELNGFKIKAQVCYDLRFPVWARNQEDYDVLFYCSNWPDQRLNAWKTLLKARAIENQCFVLGVNCFGKDVWDNTYSGHSAIISYDGTTIEKLKGREDVIQAELSFASLKKFRENLPFLKDRDRFNLIGD